MTSNALIVLLSAAALTVGTGSASVQNRTLLLSRRMRAVHAELSSSGRSIECQEPDAGLPCGARAVRMPWKSVSFRSGFSIRGTPAFAARSRTAALG